MTDPKPSKAYALRHALAAAVIALAISLPMWVLFHRLLHWLDGALL